ncbi:MAG: hypothetical protein WC384_16705 [Prolixibacteraceae bacterium]|jgi:hypothetical protein
MNKDKLGLAKHVDIYLDYLACAPSSSLNLTSVSGDFTIDWFNPVTDGKLMKGSVKSVKGGKVISLGTPLKPIRIGLRS